MQSSPSSAKKWLATTPSHQPIILTDLFTLGQNPDRICWESFRPGVEIHSLYGDLNQGPAAALLKYQPGAIIPAHEHSGYEHIVVLSGDQRDHQGTHVAGSLVINTPGSKHDIVSENGCIVLIIWEKPVVMTGED